jgi:hypothetical protein
VDSSAFTLTPDQEKIKEAARQFGEKWAPRATEIDRTHRLDLQRLGDGLSAGAVLS